MKDVDQWFVLTVSAIENGKYHLFAFYDHSEDVLKEKDYLKQIETTKHTIIQKKEIIKHKINIKRIK